MVVHIVYTLLIIAFVAFTVFGLGDNKGRQFVMGFIHNRILVEQPIIRIYVTSHAVGTVTFTVPLQRAEFPPVTKPIQPGVVLVKEYPYALHMSGTDYNKKCILIESSVDVTVQGASVNNLTSDAYLALPTWALGTEYYVMSYLYRGPPTTHVHGPSQFAVVALEADTQVTLVPPDDVFFYGQLDLTLSAYQAYQVQAETSDLTGVRVVASKSVAVISGTDWTAVRGLYMGDHLLEQLLPTHTWGSEFLVPPLATRTSGDTYRIIAVNDETRVRVAMVNAGDHKTFVLDAGSYVTFDSPSNQPIHIVATSGIMVAQFAKSFQADNNRLSDPMMLVVPPISQYTTWYTFSTITTIRTGNEPYGNVTFANFLNLIIPADKMAGMRLDGLPLEKRGVVEAWPPAEARVGQYVFLTVAVEDGYHLIGHNTGQVEFGALLYGFKFQEGYGMPLGQKITTIQHVCLPSFTFQGDNFDNDCDGKIDEEQLNDIDDDNDGRIDEDLEPGPVYTTTSSPDASSFGSTDSQATLTNQPEGPESPTPGKDSTQERQVGSGEVTTINATTLSTVSQRGTETSEGVMPPGGQDLDITTPSQNKQNKGLLTEPTDHVPTTGTQTGDRQRPTTEQDYALSSIASNYDENVLDATIEIPSSSPQGNLTASLDGIIPSTLEPGGITNSELNDPQSYDKPVGITCHGSSCNILVNGTTVMWTDIRLVASQTESLGVYWLGTFWLFDGSNWSEADSLTRLLTASGENVCLLLQARLWCVKEGMWTVVLDVDGVPESYMWVHPIYFLTDNNAWSWAAGQFFDFSSQYLGTVFGIFTQWNRLLPERRLGVVWMDKIWMFGDSVPHDLSNSLPSDALTVHWGSTPWTWDGSGWYRDQDNLLNLINNTFSIFWNGMLWSWNGTEWLRILHPALRPGSGEGTLLFVWSNRTWYLNNTLGPWEPTHLIHSDIIVTPDQPAIGINDTLWVLTPEGEWVPAFPVDPPDVNNSLFGVSWGPDFWILDEGANSWHHSTRHKTEFLRDGDDVDRPGILNNNTFWQWTGDQWEVKVEHVMSSRTQKHVYPVIEVRWKAEAWQLSDTLWSPIVQGASDNTIVGNAVLAVSLGALVWFYNGTHWKDSMVTRPSSDPESTGSLLEESPLGVIHGDEVWIWVNASIKEEPEGISVVDPAAQLQVGDKDLGVISGGTLWTLGKSSWSAGMRVSNDTPTFKGDTQLRVLYNDTLWGLNEDRWEKEEGIIDISISQLANEPAVIVNDTLWVLDQENPMSFDVSIISSKSRDRITLAVVWDGRGWQYNSNNIWSRVHIPENQGQAYPTRFVIVYGSLWSMEGVLLMNSSLTDFDDNQSTLIESLYFYYMLSCQQWKNWRFITEYNCLLQAEKTAIDQELVVIVNNIKWVFNTSSWSILNGAAGGEGDIGGGLEGTGDPDWINNLGFMFNGTVWIWDSSKWVKLHTFPNFFQDFVDNRTSLVIFLNGQIWAWNGNAWAQSVILGAVADTLGALLGDDGTLFLDFSGGSWYWDGTKFVPSLDSLAQDELDGELHIGINDTAWVCNQSNCWLKPDDLQESIGNLLEQAPVGSGVNTTIWVWNGTAWVPRSEITGTGQPGNPVYILVNGKVLTWDGSGWVETSLNVTGSNVQPPTPVIIDKIDTDTSVSQVSTSSPVLGYTEETSGPISAASVIVNGTVWIWDGFRWTSGNRTLDKGSLEDLKVTATVNGTTWVWNGSSWVAAEEEHGGEGESSNRRTTEQGPTTVVTGGKTEKDKDTMNIGTTDGTTVGTDNADKDRSSMNLTQKADNSTNTTTWNSTVQVPLETYTSPNTSLWDMLFNMTGLLTTVGTVKDDPDLNSWGPSTPETVKVSPTGSAGGGGPGGEPSSAAAAEGQAVPNTIIIIAVIVPLLLLLILLILLLCWCKRCRKKKQGKQKVNPVVATHAVPRPTSHNQHPPPAADRPPTPSMASFGNPWQAQTSTSSSSSITTASLSIGRRSPRVSQAPPLDLPDLIISLPPDSHIRLRSPRLSPDAGAPLLANASQQANGSA